MKRPTINLSQMKPVEQLEWVLHEELRLYEDYVQFLKKDHQYMTELKVDDLETNNKSKDTLLLKLKTLDQARDQLVRQIAQASGIEEKKITISDICRVISGVDGQKLMSVRNKLQNVIRELKTAQNETTQIAQASLGWINGAMSTLKRLFTPHSTYNGSGKVESTRLFAGRVVEKEA